MMMLKLAIRNIFRHRVRSLITLSTMIFGCVAIIFVGGFFNDIFDKIREGYISSRSGHIQVYRRGFIEHGKVEPYQHMIHNPDEIKAMIKKIPEVQYVSGRLNFYGLISTGDNTTSFIGEGIEPANEQGVPLEIASDLQKLMRLKQYNGRPAIVAGKTLAPEDFYDVMLGHGLAKTIGVEVGTPVVLLTSTVSGATNALDVYVKGMFVTSEKEFDDVCLRVPLPMAQSLLNTQSVQALLVKLDRTQDTTRIYESLKKMIASSNLDLELRRWEELADNYEKTVELFNMFYLILKIVIGIVVVLGIFNTMNMAVMERFSEIGTIMALGTRRSGVMKLFLIEGLVLGFIGGAVGVVAGAFILSIISYIGIRMPPPPGGTFDWLATPLIVPSILVSTFFLSIAIGGISSLYPAYKASRLQIIEALRYR